MPARLYFLATKVWSRYSRIGSVLIIAFAACREASATSVTAFAAGKIVINPPVTNLVPTSPEPFFARSVLSTESAARSAT